MPPRSIKSELNYKYKYSVCTLVTNTLEYAEMVNSYVKAGFSEEVCEFLYADNTVGNKFEAFGALNYFLQEAQGEYIILCHQDVLLHDSNEADLERCIQEMNLLDPNWGILSNAGGVNFREVAMHVTQANGRRLVEKRLPLKVTTVDENFIVVKSSANLALSKNLEGFHLYGTDICLVADTLGYTSFVVDFNLMHKSNGNADESFYQLESQLKKKYRYAFRGRYISTTITNFYLGGSPLTSLVLNNSVVMFFVRQYYKFFKSKDDYQAKAVSNDD